MTDFEPPSLGGRRVVRVTLRKKGLGMMVHWWRKCVKVRSSGKKGEKKRKKNTRKK